MCKVVKAITSITLIVCLSILVETAHVQAGSANIQNSPSTINQDSSNTSGENCTVTYIANEGFLIETVNHKVLIDALFGNIAGDWCDQPADSVLNTMIKGVVPFENIDLVLITHKHVDHFNEQMVLSFMKNNHKTVLVCPNQVDEILKQNPDYSTIADRIYPLASGEIFDSSFTINSVDIRAMRFDHVRHFVTDSVSGKKYNLHRDIENLGYLLSVDGFSIFHSGDDCPSNELQYENYSFGKNDIDLAFLDRVFLGPGGMDLVNKYIHAKNIVFMHVEPNNREYYRNVIRDFPELIVFARQMEKMVFAK